jgi:Tol biopolymer transport system component
MLLKIDFNCLQHQSNLSPPRLLQIIICMISPVKKLKKLFDFQVQEPTFSPDGKKIAYAKENNLFVYDVTTTTSTPITRDGQKK